MDPAAVTRDRLVTIALESAAKVLPEETQPDLAWPRDPFWRRKIRLACEAHRLGQQLNAMAGEDPGLAARPPAVASDGNMLGA